MAAPAPRATATLQLPLREASHPPINKQPIHPSINPSSIRWLLRRRRSPGRGGRVYADGGNGYWGYA
eukprot:scaffold156_cov308-Prasinococcus_capsulatus_cf.AAC.11